MIAQLITGTLVNVDTVKGELIINTTVYGVIGEVKTLLFGARLKKWREGVWEKLIGRQVEVDTVNGVAVGITDLDELQRQRRLMGGNKS